MADNNELQAARLDGAVDDGIAIASKWPNFEAAVRNIFTFPADTVLEEAMDIDPTGDVEMTGDLTLAGAPTTDLMAATKAYLVSKAVGMGIYRARAYITSDQSITGATYIPFDNANLNEGDIWDIANPTRLTIPADGHYVAGCSVSYDVGGLSKGWTSIFVNRSSSQRYDLIYEEQSIAGEVAVSGLQVIPDLVAGDYLELRVYPRSYSAADLYAANTTFWLFNLG